MNILTPAFKLFALRKLPWSEFTFPCWLSALAITLIGVLMGFDPSMHAGLPEGPGFPLFASIPLAVLTIWAGFLVIVGVLMWWMKRGGRWDGQGDLFNLVAASWLVADGVFAGLVVLGVPGLLTLPVVLYSVWVGGNALAGAIPNASLGYSIGGIVIGLIPAMLVSMLIMLFAGIALIELGVVSPPA